VLSVVKNKQKRMSKTITLDEVQANLKDIVHRLEPGEEITITENGKPVGTSYDRLSAEAAAILKIEDHLPNFEIDQLTEVMTFLVVEKRIASSLRERVQTTADTINADDVRAIATRRQSGHWASLTVAGSTDAPRQALHAVYDALVAAADFYALRSRPKVLKAVVC